MASSVVSGAVLALLDADTLWNDQEPLPAVYPHEMPEPLTLPYVVLHDRGEDSTETEWITLTQRFVTHLLAADVYARGATDADQDNPSEVIAGHLERILAPVVELGLTSTLAVSLLQTKHLLTEEKQRATDKARVYKVELEWRIRLYKTA